MIRQYRPQRFRYETLRGRSREVGTVPIGTIRRVCISGQMQTLRVEAWLPRTIGAVRRGADGRYENGYTAYGGHIAVCRDLRNGKTCQISDAWLADDRW